MTPRPKRSIQRARATVLSLIAANDLLTGSELPSSKKLAEMAEVSRVTMWKALGDLKRERFLDGSHGHRFRVGPHRAASLRPAPAQPVDLDALAPSTAWRRTRDSIIHDILTGGFAPGSELPSAKELQRRYKVSWAPVRKALADLCANGTIEHHYKRYSVPTFTGSSFRSRIIVLTPSLDSFSLYLGQQDEEFLKSLERQCMHARIALDTFMIIARTVSPPDTLEFALVERRSGREFEIDALDRQDIRATLGYIFLVHGQPASVEQRIFRMLSTSRKPCVILSEEGGWSLPLEYANSKRMRLLSMSESSLSARAVARFLLAQGHRRIAFVSPVHQYFWSCARLRGLEDAVRHATPDVGIHSYTTTTHTYEVEPALSLAKPPRGGLSPAHRAEYDSLAANIELTAVPRLRNRIALYQLLDAVMRDMDKKHITAVITVNDDTAFMTLEYLKARGLTVPDDLSVISFDDTADALKLNLASYNFNVGSLATNALGYILGRKPFAGLHDTGLGSVGGYIAERQTVGPPRRITRGCPSR